MNKYLEVTLSILLVITFTILSWLSGYLVDPAFLGMLTPFVLIPIFLTPIILLFRMTVGLRKPNNRNRFNYVACFVSALSVLFMCSPYRPTSTDGFYYRMSKIDKYEYIAAADLVKSEAEKLGISQKNLTYPRTKVHDKFVETLIGKNIIFSISKSPVHISNEDGNIIFTWGGGLTGAYEVLVTYGGNEPNGLKEEPKKFKKIYENVVLLVD